MIRILGVMTGTSCDGLDAACIEVGSRGWKATWSASIPYPGTLRSRVLRMQEPRCRIPIRDWLRTHADLGDWYGRELGRLFGQCRRRGLGIPDLIANHGQTVAHFPSGGGGTTLQLGDPARIARMTGLTVASNFRDGDLAAGGQGAPLVPRFHELLARHLGIGKAGTAIHNIGGISNLTYLGPKGAILAFDTGPGNIWIDAAAGVATRGRQGMDRDGVMAEKGIIDVRAVREILRHPYFSKPAPKSTGRDDFPLSLLLRRTRARDASLVATATAVTVASIGEAYGSLLLGKGLPVKKILFCGGGARNPVLMRWLSECLEGVETGRLDEFGIDSQFVEAYAFAYYGYLALKGQALGGPWTGAQGFAPPAHLVPGKNWGVLLRKLSRSG